jgi:hypothetical protein
MRGFPDLDELASCTGRASQRLGAAWLIPLTFFAATVVSLAAGVVVPAMLGAAKPWSTTVGMNAATELARSGDDDYVQGLTKLRREEHGHRSIPSNGEMLYCAVPAAPVGIAHPM